MLLGIRKGFYRGKFMEKKIYLPLTEEQAANLKAGDNVLLSGIIYTARDAAHERLVKLIEEKEKLPIELKDWFSRSNY